MVTGKMDALLHQNKYMWINLYSKDDYSLFINGSDFNKFQKEETSAHQILINDLKKNIENNQNLIKKLH